MPINNEEIVKLLRNLAKEEKLNVTVKKCVLSGVIVGLSTTVGGLLLGPVGLAAGAVVSGCATAFSQKNKFQSVLEIIDDMSLDEKEALAENVRCIINHLDVTDAVALAGLLSGNTSIRKLVVNELINFVNNEAKKAIVNQKRVYFS